MGSVPYPTPGEILQFELLEPMGISPAKLAEGIGAPLVEIEEILSGKRSMSTDIALGLSRLFGMNGGFWTGLQADYDARMQVG